MSVDKARKDQIMLILQRNTKRGTKVFSQQMIKMWGVHFRWSWTPYLYELRRKGLVEQLQTGDWRLTPAGKNYESKEAYAQRRRTERWVNDADKVEF